MNRAEELRTLALMQEENGDYRAALELYRRAFHIHERAVAKDSPEIAPFIYDLAMINAALDHDGEAGKLLNWLLRILPSEHHLRKECELVLTELQQAQSAA